MAPASDQLLTGVLKDVSRSFYQTLKVLPAGIRSQIGLAYLLARTTDTVADTELVPPELRLETLRQLSARVRGDSSAPIDFGKFTGHQGSPAERVLLERCEESIGLLAKLSEADLQLVRQVLEIITSGQELDLKRFAGGSSTQLLSLRTEEEFEDYTYRVAGCVGEFWTRICRAHCFPKAPLNEAELLRDAVRFGKGLQMVNILRDVPADLRRGRCYVPEERLHGVGLTPADLLRPDSETRFRPVYDAYLEQAAKHLQAGWSYTNSLPRRCVRIRLACAWPILIGMETLQLLRTTPVLNPEKRIKVSRRRIKQIMIRSIVLYPASGLWRKMAETVSDSAKAR
jgi:farnesyl-diphosphate farnesyltransferase